jgi:hypothetical protein
MYQARKEESKLDGDKMKNKINELLLAVSNDCEFYEGVIGNCRWAYFPTSDPKNCGILSLATYNGFDRWASSSIVNIQTILWEVNDPDFKKFVDGLVSLFNG